MSGHACGIRPRSCGFVKDQQQVIAHSGKPADGGLHGIGEGAIQKQGQYPVVILAENAVLLQVRNVAAEHLVGPQDTSAGAERLQEIQALGGAKEFQRQDCG